VTAMAASPAEELVALCVVEAGTAGLLIPGEAAHRFRDDCAPQFRFIAAQCSE